MAAYVDTIRSQLENINTELNEIKSRGSFKTDEITAIQERLHALDEQYHEGHFADGSEIPEGQAVLSELLENAHDLAHELLESTEDDE